jgi:hypothetical protein
MLCVILPFIINDFRANDPDKWYGLIGACIIAFLPLVILNFVVRMIDRRKFKQLATSPPIGQVKSPQL